MNLTLSRILQPCLLSRVCNCAQHSFRFRWHAQYTGNLLSDVRSLPLSYEFNRKYRSQRRWWTLCKH
jgi:hypothetical protein